MSTTSQQYAVLSDDCYDDRPAGVRRPGEEELVHAYGVTFKVLEHVNNRGNGYQGTVYQREDSGEIVVAHRGTEGGKFKSDTPEFFNDLVRADGGMLLARGCAARIVRALTTLSRLRRLSPARHRHQGI